MQYGGFANLSILVELNQNSFVTFEVDLESVPIHKIFSPLEEFDF
jgi:hypothetical protein